MPMARTFDLYDSPGYQLWLATNRWQRFIRRVLNPLDLTYVQYAILSAVFGLSANEPHITQAMVCRHAELDPNMSSEVVRSLEAKGLLRREPHPEDGRAATMSLTNDGRDLVSKARDEIAPLIEQFFAPLVDQRDELVRMLRSLIDEAERPD